MQTCNKVKTSLYVDEDLIVELNQMRAIEERTFTYILNKMLRKGLYDTRKETAKEFDKLGAILERGTFLK
jgi:hypothetical protein